MVWPTDPKEQAKILKKFFKKKSTIPATCTSKDGKLTVLRQDKKSKPGVPKGKKTPKTKSTPKSKKESTRLESKRRANVTFSPSPVKSKFAKGTNYSENDDADLQNHNPVDNGMSSKKKKKKSKT